MRFFEKKKTNIVTEVSSCGTDVKRTSVYLYVDGDTEKCEVEIVIDKNRVGAPREQKTVTFKGNGHQVVIDGVLYSVVDEYNGNPFNGIKMDVPMELSYHVPAEEKIDYINGYIVKVSVRK